MPYRALFAAFLALAAFQLQAEETLWTDQNMPGSVQNKLSAGQDLALDKRFEEAEALIRQAMKEVPEHPLGAVFLIATRLSEVQERFKAGSAKVPASFFEDADHAIALGEAQRKAFPEEPYPKVYLGAAYGIRGLAKLYAGSYLASYRDGKRGAGMLREAVDKDPGLYNAYMGLGQFEYYCGTLSGVLQFVLALPGDPDKGLEMLKTCEDKGSYASWPCKAYRVKLVLADRKDYKSVQSELLTLTTRYPHNDELAKSLFDAIDGGVNTPAYRKAAEEALLRLRQGWEISEYSPFKEGEARMVLAKAYLAAGDKAAAKGHLARLDEIGTKTQRREAQGLVEWLNAEAEAAAAKGADGPTEAKR